MFLHCGAVCGGGVRKGTMPLAWLSTGFQSCPLLPRSKLGPSGADSWVGRFVYVLGPCGFHQWTLLWGWEFLLPPQPSPIFTARGFEAFFFRAGTLGCVVYLAPHLFLQIYPHENVGLPSPPAATLPAQSSSYLLAMRPVCPGCPFHPFYQSEWMFALYFLGCWTSIQFYFQPVLVVSCF